MDVRWRAVGQIGKTSTQDAEVRKLRKYDRWEIDKT